MKTPAGKFRLSNSIRIAELFKHGLRVSDGWATLIGLPNELGHPRLAVAVGKRHGNAVRRNRIKRLCREAYRLIRSDLPAGWDLVLLPRPRPDCTLDAFRQSLLTLSRRLAERKPPQPQDPAK